MPQYHLRRTHRHEYPEARCHSVSTQKPNKICQRFLLRQLHRAIELQQSLPTGEQRASQTAVPDRTAVLKALLPDAPESPTAALHM